jgi:hypothetical protein
VLQYNISHITLGLHSMLAAVHVHCSGLCLYLWL